MCACACACACACVCVCVCVCAGWQNCFFSFTPCPHLYSPTTALTTRSVRTCSNLNITHVADAGTDLHLFNCVCGYERLQQLAMECLWELTSDYNNAIYIYFALLHSSPLPSPPLPSPPLSSSRLPSPLNPPLSPPEGSCRSHSHQPSWSAFTLCSTPATARVPTQQYTWEQGRRWEWKEVRVEGGGGVGRKRVIMRKKEENSYRVAPIMLIFNPVILLCNSCHPSLLFLLHAPIIPVIFFQINFLMKYTHNNLFTDIYRTKF